MATVQKITPSMFDDVYAEFLADDDPALHEADWRPLFSRRPDQEEDYCGLALADGGKIVGLLGLIFSRRSINGVQARFCNLHSWFVKEAYRGYSLLMLRPVLRLTDYTLTDFTPTERVRTISRKLGFRDLDSALRILPPVSLPSRSLARRNIEVVADIGDIRSRLDESQATLLRDHRGAGFGHLLVTDGPEHCYLIFRRVERHVLPYCYIHYVSNKRLFARVQLGIRRRLLHQSRARFCAVDARMFAGIRLPFSFRLPLASGQLYRSSSVSAEDIDSLYSEVSYLGLTTFPDLGHRLKRFAERFHPARLRRRPSQRAESCQFQP